MDLTTTYRKPVRKASIKRKAPVKPAEPVPEPDDVIVCQKDKLAIIGTAETLPQAPYEDPEFEVWAVAQCTTYPGFKRGDLLFELHPPDYWKDPNVLTRINAWPGKTVMQEKYPEVPGSLRYPKEAILQYRRYHTTSITYMLALAYHSYKTTGKPAHVAMFGVHMESREEYSEQRPCCEYWLARMEEAGMDIFLAGGAILRAPWLYGYENYDAICYKLRQRIEGLTAGMNIRAEEQHAAELKKHEQKGAVTEAEYWLREAQTGAL
uniref:Uncharacterized protein n=1 Tax=viral metagenome TaxID=1070528 RepID=A0A6M3KXI4_9ZZZZ